MKPVLACCGVDQPHTPDSVLNMGACGHMVWISQSRLEAIRDLGLEPRCMLCLPEDIELGMTPGIRREVEKTIGKEEADRVLATFEDPEEFKKFLSANRCDHSARCCNVHNTHSTPHVGCIFR